MARHSSFRSSQGPHPVKHALNVTREQDFAAWYQAVITEADMAEESGVRGCMVIRPWGYGIWERIQKLLDEQIKATGRVTRGQLGVMVGPIESPGIRELTDAHSFAPQESASLRQRGGVLPHAHQIRQMIPQSNRREPTRKVRRGKTAGLPQ